VAAELEAFLSGCLPELEARAAELARHTVTVVMAPLESMAADPHTDWQTVADDGDDARGLRGPEGVSYYRDRSALRIRYLSNCSVLSISPVYCVD
jgi:hypothetical protein